jgi:hypothetical protein
MAVNLNVSKFLIIFNGWFIGFILWNNFLIKFVFDKKTTNMLIIFSYNHLLY